MNKIILYSLVTLVLSLTTVLNAKNQPTNSTLEEKIEVLEKNYKANVEKLLSDKVSLSTDKTKIENLIRKHKEEMADELKFFKIFRWLFPSISFIGILLALWKVPIFIRSTIQNTINSEMKSIFDDNKENIRKLINQENDEQRIKMDKKLCVVSQDLSKINNIKNILETVGFLNIYDITHGNLEQMDLFILDGMYKSDDNHEFLKIKINETKHSSAEYVYYGNDRFNAPENVQINFSNSKYTLFWSIMVIFKYLKK